MILVIAEQKDGKLNRATWETIVGAQQLAQANGSPVTVLVPGANGAGVAAELAAAQVNDVVTVEHAALEPYTPDGFTAALQDAIAQLGPTHILLPHTYQTRDFAPKLAARLDRAIITDVTGIKPGAEPAFVRPMFQGKLTADVVPQGPAPKFRCVHQHDQLIRLPDQFLFGLYQQRVRFHQAKRAQPMRPHEHALRIEIARHVIVERRQDDILFAVNRPAGQQDRVLGMLQKMFRDGKRICKHLHPAR